MAELAQVGDSATTVGKGLVVETWAVGTIISRLRKWQDSHSGIDGESGRRR